MGTEIKIRIKFRKELSEENVKGMKLAFSKQMDMLLGVINKGRKTMLGNVPPVDPDAEYVIEDGKD